MLAFAANSVLNRLAVADGSISAELFATIRVSAGALVLAILVLRSGSLGDRPSLWGTLGLAAYLIGFSQAYLTLGAGLGALILFGGVQITMFAGALVAGEDLPLRRWFGMAIAFSGLVIVVGSTTSNGQNGAWAISAMSVAAVGWGIYSLVGRGLSDPLGATARNFLWATPFVALSLFGQSLAYDSFGVLLAVISGALTSGLAYALWYRVLPELGASRGAVVQLSVPVIAILAGAFLLGESVTASLLFGSAIVLGGIAISLRA